MDACREIILNLLQNLGSKREIDQYLRAFTGIDSSSSRFAVIKVGGGLLLAQLDGLASSLAFLRRVGVCPVVVHGAGPQLTAALKEQNLETQFHGGRRVTTPDVLNVARRVFQTECARLADAVEAKGVRARPISSGVFEAERVRETSLGLVGEVRRVDLSLITAAVDAGHVPIVSSLGETSAGQILNINADVAARELALAIRPRKIVFLTPTGGLLDADGQLISAVNLAEDYDRFLSGSWLHGGMALKLREIKKLLDQLPAHSSVSVTSPDHLARELFTHRGEGTLIRRGVSIAEHQSLDSVETSRLGALIEASFGRRLRPDYFQRRTPARLLISTDYSAAAVLMEGKAAAYLDKFVVTAESQGAGVGASLWSRLETVAPALFWRARPDNRVNHWYFDRADGTYRSDEWIVFWRGVPHARDIRACVREALETPSSFIDDPAQRVEAAHVT